METASSSDAIEPTRFIPEENGKDNLDEGQPKLLKLKSKFYDLYGEYFKLKARVTLWRDSSSNDLIIDGRNTIKAIVSDLNIHDFKPTIPYFEQKRVVREESLVRADKELNILEGINSKIRLRLEELEKLENYTI